MIIFKAHSNLMVYNPDLGRNKRHKEYAEVNTKYSGSECGEVLQ